jgi:hypothetical protein
MGTQKARLMKVVAAISLVLSAWTSPFIPAVEIAGATPVPGAASGAGFSAGGAQAVTNLVIPGPVVVELVDADALFKHLPPDDFIGVRDAYYAYDRATTTYWAAGQTVPSLSAYRALVASQDDGSYTVFHKPAHGAWVAVDDGMAAAPGTGCGAYHVSVPAGVLAVWHWGPGHCTPPNSGAGPVLFTYLAEARKQWSAGDRAASAKQGAYWLSAAKELQAALTAAAPQTTGFAAAAQELQQLAKLPDAMLSAAQSKEALSLTMALNKFFGTNGLYGVSTPSANARDFVATLRQEAKLGTLASNVVADPHLHTVPSSFPQAVVTCPVATGVAPGSVFACKLDVFAVYYVVGTVRAPGATAYFGYMVKGSPTFDCQSDGFGTGEQMAVKKLGGTCRA